MKALRNSLKSNKEPSISGPLPRISKPSPALQPPQKVIRATSAYKSQAPQELSFQKGDFFYIFSGMNDGGAYYEAHNPVSGARGLVPKALFEEFQKSSSKLHITPPPIPSGHASPNGLPTPGLGPKSPKPQVFYAIVMHDFVAERADELDAKAGDPISVVAQSNREWFVAKPIGRLGRPGLIPVSFVEVRDPLTNQAIDDIGALIDRGDLPRVEEWKRQMLTYKANSISLGVIDDASLRGPVPNSPYMPQYPPTPEMPEEAPPALKPSNGYDSNGQYHAGPSRPASPSILPEGVLLTADVTSFHNEMDEYWFRINAVYQPFEPPNSNVLPPGKQLVLFRSYNDFFDFQVQLLEMFPREAGREPPHKRILPYMPGPVDIVDANVTAQRRVELDAYVHHLCDLLRTSAQHILQHRVLREFLSVKPGDVESDVEPQVEQIRAMRDVHGSGERTQNGGAHDHEDIDPLADDDYEDELKRGLSRTTIRDDDEHSEGSVYEDDTRTPGQAHDRDQTHNYYSSSTNGNGKQYGYQPAFSQDQHARSGSTSSLSHYRTQSPGDSAYHSRSNSPVYPASNKDKYSLRNQVLSPRESESTRNSGYSQSSSHMSAPNSASSATSPTSARSRSIANTPPISASNQQPAFVKIKIFDRVADDLIAIRVHPKVTLSQLVEKVQGRLGGNIAALSYRNSMNNGFVELMHDADLREWIETADKYVLYAE